MGQRLSVGGRLLSKFDDPLIQECLELFLTVSRQRGRGVAVTFPNVRISEIARADIRPP